MWSLFVVDRGDDRDPGSEPAHHVSERVLVDRHLGSCDRSGENGRATSSDSGREGKETPPRPGLFIDASPPFPICATRQKNGLQWRCLSVVRMGLWCRSNTESVRPMRQRIPSAFSAI